MVVIDPGHGGTDTGARGTTLAEKDVVLQVAKILRAELERAGYRVVMTRNDDSNPSYEDRAAAANAYRDAIFVSLHVSSTGAIGNTRAYFYEFPVPFQPTDASFSPEPLKQGFSNGDSMGGSAASLRRSKPAPGESCPDRTRPSVSAIAKRSNAGTSAQLALGSSSRRSG